MPGFLVIIHVKHQQYRLKQQNLSKHDPYKPLCFGCRAETRFSLDISKFKTVFYSKFMPGWKLNFQIFNTSPILHVICHTSVQHMSRALLCTLCKSFLYRENKKYPMYCLKYILRSKIFTTYRLLN